MQEALAAQSTEQAGNKGVGYCLQGYLSRQAVAYGHFQSARADDRDGARPSRAASGKYYAALCRQFFVIERPFSDNAAGAEVSSCAIFCSMCHWLREMPSLQMHALGTYKYGHTHVLCCRGPGGAWRGPGAGNAQGAAAVLPGALLTVQVPLAGPLTPFCSVRAVRVGSNPRVRQASSKCGIRVVT